MRRPARYPIELYRGDSYAWQFAVWLDDAKTEPADLAGVTAAAQIRDVPMGVHLVELAATVELPNLVNVELPADAWPSTPVPCEAAWDLQLTYPSGAVLTLVAGPATITPDVTEPPVEP
jgi:hypothetical protein